MDDLAIAVVLWDGVEELDFAGPYEVLTAWARESDRAITVRTVSESTEPVRCSHGLRLSALRAHLRLISQYVYTRT